EMLVRQQAESALKETNAELESFAYSVSHDLRAPLRAMQGFAQALLEDCGPRLSSNELDYASRIVAAATRLDTLIQDLLLYSLISHGKLELGAVELRHATKEAISHVESMLQESKAVV